MLQAGIIGALFVAMVVLNVVFVALSATDRLKQNNFIGIRIPAALTSPEAWYVAQKAFIPFRLIAAIVYVAGFVALITGLGMSRFGLLATAVCVDLGLYFIGHVVANRKLKSSQGGMHH